MVRFTTVHVNSIILSVMLFIIQMYIVYEIETNGGLSPMIDQKDIAGLVLVFSPTAGIVWALKRFSSDVTDRGD